MQQPALDEKRQNVGPKRQGSIPYAGVPSPDPKICERTAKLRGDLICWMDAGGNPAHLLARASVKFEDILSQKPLPQSVMAELLDLFAGAVSDDFAIHAAENIRPQYLGILGCRLSNCHTVGDVLVHWARYSIIIGYPLSSVMTVDDDGWTLSFHPRYRLSRRALRFCLISSMAGIVHSLFNLSGQRIRLLEAAFPYAPFANSIVPERIGAQTVLFDCPVAQVRGCLADLDRAILAADMEVMAFADDICQRALESLRSDRSLAAIVGNLCQTLSIDQLSEANVSQALGMSGRSLQRGLSAENVTFRDIVDDIRRTRAIAAASGGEAAKQIAYDLGFSDISSFSRAFRRWTGQAFSQWQKANRMSYEQSFIVSH